MGFNLLQTLGKILQTSACSDYTKSETILPQEYKKEYIKNFLGDFLVIYTDNYCEKLKSFK